MDPDIMLVAGLMVGVFSIPSIMALWQMFACHVQR
jgi:hypothetical protein